MGQMKKIAEKISYSLGYDGVLDAPVVRGCLEKLSCYMETMPFMDAVKMALEGAVIAKREVDKIIDARVAINSVVCDPVETIRLARMQRQMRGGGV